MGATQSRLPQSTKDRCKLSPPHMCSWCRFDMKNPPVSIEEHLLKIGGKGRDQCAKVLIKKGGLDLHSFHVIKFLMIVSEANHEILECLIKAGADVNIRDTFGKTALTYAAAAGKKDCVNLLIAAGAEDKNTALLCAAMANRCECVRILVQAGADVNIKGKSWNSALTSVTGCPVCVEVLLEAGADVNATNIDGLSLLLKSIKTKNIRCVKLLLKYGADVNATDIDGLSPLLLFIKSKNIPCVKLLLKYGVDVNLVHKYDSPLTCAIDVPYAHDCVAELIQAGADVNLKRRRDGFTPLMLAEYCNGERLVRLLLRSGCKINIRNERGQNALEDCASVSNRNVKLMTLLFAAGETIEGKITYSDRWKHREVDLNHLCREAIRKHLLEMDPYTHLFDRVPRLGLPRSLCAYVLYNQTLGEDDAGYDSNCSDFGMFDLV